MESRKCLVVVGLLAWQAKSENIFSRCRQKNVDNLHPLGRFPVLPVTAHLTKLKNENENILPRKLHRKRYAIG